MSQRRCWAEISLARIKENLQIVRRHVGARIKILAVVKGNAYGHGALPVAQALAAAGADGFGVTSTEEGIELRQGGIQQPILLMAGFYPGEEGEVLAHNLTAGICELGQLARLEQAARTRGRRVPCHVKVDTGMGRLGIPSEAVPQVLDMLSASQALELEGLYTHFAASEDFTSPQTAEQVACFARVREQFAARGLRPPLLHLANTGGIVARPETWGTMVRPGSLLYGYLSFFKFAGADRTAEFYQKLPVQPALTLKAMIYLIREFPPGKPLGYGARFVTQRPSRIAILPIGYADGWRRGLSGQCRVLVRGRYAPVVGTIGMDLIHVDATDIPEAQPGDEAILIGSSGSASIPPTEPARALGSVASEILSGLGPRIPRLYAE